MISNVFSLGLAALSNLVGCQVVTSFDCSEDIFVKLSNQLDCSVDRISEHIVSSQDIYSFNCSNDFILFVCDNNEYFLYDKKTSSQVEHGSYIDSVFSRNANEFLVYKKGDIFKYNVTDCEFTPERNLLYSSAESAMEDWENANGFEYSLINNIDVLDQVNKINDFKYFYYLKNYGSNYEGVCPIISDQMVLGYLDSYFDDSVVDDYYDTTGWCELPSLNPLDWTESPGTGNYVHDQRFKEYLKQRVQIVNDFVLDGSGITCYQNLNLINDYISRSQSHLNYSVGFQYYTGVCEYIETSINEGKPVIADGSGHNVVIFGYDDDYYYLNTGWNGWIAKTPKSTYGVNYDKPASAITISIISQHVHSNNYYSAYYHTNVCGCGYTSNVTGAIQIKPADWGFAEQYYYYNKNTDYYFGDGLTIHSSRKRTGFIQSKTINLSPRKIDAGYAYFSIETNKPLTKFKLDMAWWSQYEYETDGYAYIFCKDSLGNWCQNFVNIHTDCTLSHSFEDLATNVFYLPTDDQYYGIKIQLSNNPVGDRNKGRLSLGNIELYYNN